MLTFSFSFSFPQSYCNLGSSKTTTKSIRIKKKGPMFLLLLFAFFTCYCFFYCLHRCRLSFIKTNVTCSNVLKRINDMKKIYRKWKHVSIYCILIVTPSIGWRIQFIQLSILSSFKVFRKFANGKEERGCLTIENFNKHSQFTTNNIYSNICLSFCHSLDHLSLFHTQNHSRGEMQMHICSSIYMCKRMWVIILNV